MIHIEGENDDEGLDARQGSSPPKMAAGAGDMEFKRGSSADEDNQDDDGKSSDDESLHLGVNDDPDAVQDAYVKGFLKDLLKVGQFSKQILNYSYPPLLYQRGDDSQEDDPDDDGGDEMDDSGEGESSEEEDEEAPSHEQFPLGDDFNMENLMGQDLDDIDGNNADLRQHEQVIDGLFADEGYDDNDDQPHGDDIGNGNSPDGIENPNLSDIQMMINKSAEDSSPSPGLEQFGHDVLNGMNFAGDGEVDQDEDDLDQRQLDFANIMN